MNKDTALLKNRILVGVGILIFLGLVSLMLLSGDNYQIIKSVFTNGYTAEQARDMLLELGFRGYFTIALLSMLQVLIAFLPAEPVQVVAGISFGFWLGTLWCAVGVLIGNTVIFLLYKFYGDGMRRYFVKNLHINFEKASSSKVFAAVIIILYLLPAIPYGMICFLAASVGMKYHRYITLTMLGSLPSIVIGVALGNIAMSHSWELSLALFVVLLVLIVFAFAKKEQLFAKVNDYIDRHSTEGIKVKINNKNKILIPYIVARIILWFKGIRMRFNNKVGDSFEKPCIVLCNHGSFIDFVFAGTLIRKHSPNFIVARLYFYHNVLGAIMRFYGCFAKSMFTVDIESVKNSMTVIKEGGVLAFMPEARLSTAGKFEDIQPTTYSFIKKMGVPVYSIVLHGDYLADPKWSKGMVRGSLVEAELDILLTKDEVKTLSPDEIGKKIEDRLRYDEYEWLKSHPELHYNSKDLACGLENILTTCPVCSSKYTLSTDGRDIICSNCGKIATLDNRYSFSGKVPYKNIGEWYDAQLSELKNTIQNDPDYKLESKVVLKGQNEKGMNMLRELGEGVCTLTAEGLQYRGTRDGEYVELDFPIKQIYRLLFGAGEDFEVYVGKNIYYFVPEEKRSAVEWYMASAILCDNASDAQ